MAIPQPKRADTGNRAARQRVTELVQRSSLQWLVRSLSEPGTADRAQHDEREQRLRLHLPAPGRAGATNGSLTAPFAAGQSEIAAKLRRGALGQLKRGRTRVSGSVLPD